MEYEQIASGISISPLEMVDHTEFDDLLDCDNEYIDNSDSNEIVFGLSW